MLLRLASHRAAVGALAFGLAALVAPAAIFAASPQEIATDRDENMDEIGRQMKALGAAAKAGTIDADTAAAAKKLAALAKDAPTWFPKGTGPDDPGVTKTRALAVIWTDPAGFAEKMKAFQDAVPTLEPAIASKNVEGFQTALKTVGGTCKGCHETYKKRKET